MKASVLTIILCLSWSCNKSASDSESEAETKTVAEVVALKALHQAQEDYKAKHGTYVSDIKYLMGKTPTIKNFEPEMLLDKAHSFAMTIKVEDANAGPPVLEYVAVKPGNAIYAIDQTGTVKLMVTEGGLDTGDYTALKEAFKSAKAAK